MDVHRSRRIGKGLIFILVDQRDAFWIADLNHCHATPRGRRGGTEEDGNLRPTLDDLHAQIVALRMVIKRGREVILPPAREFGVFTRPSFRISGCRQRRLSKRA